MDTYVSVFLGIAVSVLLYYLTYRQTIGARKEKIRAANTEIEKILLKRVVLESYKPSIQDIGRLIEAKARDYGLRTADLYSEVQILNTLFSRIIDTDFIDADKRNAIVERILPIFVQAEEKPVEETSMVELASMKKNQRARTNLSLVMAVTASVFGTFIVFIYELANTEQFMYSVAILTVSISFLAIMFVSYIYRLREPQEEKTAYSALRTGIEFEQEVGSILNRFGAKIILAGANRNYDFFVEFRGKKILVEVKGWSGHVPLMLFRRLVDRLRRALEAEKADEAIIVIKEPGRFPAEVLEGTDVKIMSLNDLRNYFVHGESK